MLKRNFYFYQNIVYSDIMYIPTYSKIKKINILIH